MGVFSSILNVSIGAASFQAATFGVVDKPLESGGAQTGRQVEVTITGWIEGASAAAFASAAAGVAAMAVAGVDLVITGLGGQAVYSLLAAQCMNGGPLYEVTMAPGGSALHAEVTIKATGIKSSESYTSDPQSGGGAGKTTQVRVTRDPALTEQIEVTGELRGPNTAAAFASELSTWRNAYPWPEWVVSYQQTTNLEEDERKFQITVQEMTETLPLGNNGVRAVDGSRQMTVGVDEYGRRTRTWSFDLLCDGDPLAVEATIRPAGVRIVSSTVTVSGYRDLRLQASYVVVGSDLDDFVLDFQQRIEVTLEEAIVEPRHYEGQKSVLVYQQGGVNTLRQSGRIVGDGKMFKPPGRVSVDGYYPSAKPRITMAWINAHHSETTWEYELVSTAGGATPSKVIVDGLLRGNGEVAI